MSYPDFQPAPNQGVRPDLYELAPWNASDPGSPAGCRVNGCGREVMADGRHERRAALVVTGGPGCAVLVT